MYTLVAITFCFVMVVVYLGFTMRGKDLGRINPEDINRLGLKPRYLKTKERTVIQGVSEYNMYLIQTDIYNGKKVGIIRNVIHGMEHIVHIHDRIGLRKGIVRDIKKDSIIIEIEYVDNNGNIYKLIKKMKVENEPRLFGPPALKDARLR